MDLDCDGATLVAGVLNSEQVNALRTICDEAIGARPGKRVTSMSPSLRAVLSTDGSIWRLAANVLGAETRPVRVLAFDKNADTNWAVGWHQDRTIAVREPRDAFGFEPWSVKDGIQHVAPPAFVLEGMLTLRIHLDHCGSDNAPLLIAKGSHLLGFVPADEVAETAEQMPQASCEATAGDVWIYRTLILHKSAQAGTPTRRRVLQVDYSGADLPGDLEWLSLS